MNAVVLNTIDPFEPSADKPWNAIRVRHVYNRLGFGASNTLVQAGLQMQPGDFVDSIIDEVISAPAPEPPYWANWNDQDYEDAVIDDLFFIHKEEFTTRWVREMMTPATAIRAKFALFWHNHFVTQEEIYGCNAWMWRYYLLLHNHAFGNFRTFVQEMGLSEAMLVYLNGNQNIASEPNENYARELMELFTMGENNGYTQNDVVEVSRALTGYQVNFDCSAGVTFVTDFFDNTPKTIFGQTGNWNYNDVHELIFTLRAEQTATYICSKIYKHFVHDTIDTGIVAAMAQTFQDNNWDLVPVFRQLFKSEHFFEERYINAKIKSPVETFASTALMTEAEGEEEITDEIVRQVSYACLRLGQYMFNPVDVAGWPGQRAWLNENTLTRRWSTNSRFLFESAGGSDTVRDKLRQLAIDLTSTTEDDPEVITNALTEHFLNTNLETQTALAALAYFKGEVPENYFEDGTWNLYYNEVPDQIINLLNYLMRLPEWQLA